MYTGYFAKLKTYVSAGLVPVSIALVTPSWYEGKCFRMLAPSKDILNSWKYGEHQGDSEYYVQRYRDEVLGHLDTQRVLRSLEAITGVPSSRIVLLCYEKPTSFCHRHVVAEWFGDCKEYQ